MAVLRLPFAARTFGAALIGRLSYGTVFLSLTLALTTATGSVGRTGAVVAVFALVIAGLAPVRARLIDRHGARRVLLPLSLCYAGALACLAAATWRPGTPLWLLEGVAVVAGATAPPLGPTMRTLWRAMCGEDRALMQRAFSLDTVAEEVIGVSGPLLVGMLVLVVNPAFGLLLSALLVAVGTAAMMTSPVVGTAAGGRGEASASGSQGAQSSVGRRFWRRPLPRERRAHSALARIVEPVVVTAGVGVGLGAQNLVIVAFAIQHHQPSAIAWADAGMSVGSIAGGLVYGTLTWRAANRTRLPLLTAALGIAVAAAALAPDVYTLTAITTVTGVFMSPLLACAYLVADELATEQTRTAAGMWVNNAFNAGSSGGYAVMGTALAKLPLAWCFAIAAAPILLGAAAAQTWRSRADRSTTADGELVAKEAALT
jgi:MFS family permease